MKTPLKIAITCGDSDGVGLEVTSKALAKLGPQRGVQFFLWRDNKAPSKYQKLLGQSFHRKIVSSWPEGLEERFHFKKLIEINSKASPAHWFKSSVEIAALGGLDAIVTAPMSKTLIKDSGINKIGHTEILRSAHKDRSIYMGFIGEKFNIVLSSDHIPLKKVSATFNIDNLWGAILAAESIRKSLPAKKNKRPLALVGLNPHAGEEGLIGKEETETSKLLAKSQKAGIKIEGPLVPDAAFLPKNWNKYSVYICPYHDQGLIPFKMVHTQDSGIQLSLGLPYIRTSVDHGTAKDIFGRDRANPNSMYEALRWAIQLVKQKENL